MNTFLFQRIAYLPAKTRSIANATSNKRTETGANICTTFCATYLPQKNVPLDSACAAAFFLTKKIFDVVLSVREVIVFFYAFFISALQLLNHYLLRIFSRSYQFCIFIALPRKGQPPSLGLPFSVFTLDLKILNKLNICTDYFICADYFSFYAYQNISEVI